MPYIEHKYGKTYYQTRGNKKSTGKPLVCLHGGPGGHAVWMKDMFRLSDERQIFIYDQIGGGRSSATKKSQWHIRTFVNELKILVDTWKLDKFHLFGASWGTTLALEYYLNRRNNRVSSITFQSPMFSAKDWKQDAARLIKGLPAEQRKIIRYCQEVGATDSKVYQAAMSEYYARHVLRNKTRSKQRKQIRNLNGNQIYEYMWGASEFHATGTLKDYDRVSDLVNVECPSLVICGEHDEATPRSGKRYAKQLPDARFEMIPDASHAILSERPARLIKAIRGFLKETD